MDSRGVAGERSVPVERLLVDQKDVPAAIIDGYALAIRKPDVSQPPFPQEWYGMEGYGQRTWSDQRQWLLSQRAYRFMTPSDAGKEYQASPYGRTFHLADGMEVTTIPFSGAGQGADEAVVFCAGRQKAARPVEQCPQWGFRGRYGRYIVDLAFRADTDMGHPQLKAADFTELVRAVDAHAREVLHG
ncbi:hypothetical protein [Sphaerisporangium dianthi]|uniref:DUF4237 domain-containing protein n=1 Tax=Sphaerisporangium dianthi TaxID=1436120 RepID=A0ABV9CGH9_9ACTN